VAWNSAAHPRYPNGKFRPKLSQSVRLSPISVSYNVGVRIPVVPGRANLYLGALGRVERVGGNGLFQRQINTGVNKLFSKAGDPEGRSNLAQLLKGNEINAGGLRVKGPSNLINAPTFRVSSTPASREKGHEIAEAKRRPRRRRTRSNVATVPSTVTAGITTAAPKALPRGRKRVRKNSVRGRKVRR
jgi:hypothetical protein